MIHGEGGGGDVCVGCVNRGGGGAFISGEHGSKGHILRGTWKQRHYLGTGTQENKFSILGEQGNKPIHFRGTCTPPCAGIDCQWIIRPKNRVMYRQ